MTTASIRTETRTGGGIFAFDNTQANDLNAELPNQVQVICPKVNTTAEDPWVETVTLASLVLPEYAGVAGHSGNRLFRDSAGASFFSGGAIPDNAAAITALARQIATDYYQWRTPGLDLALGGAYPWTGKAHSAMVEWVHRHPDTITTRMSRSPDDARRTYHNGAKGCCDCGCCGWFCWFCCPCPQPRTQIVTVWDYSTTPPTLSRQGYMVYNPATDALEGGFPAL